MNMDAITSIQQSKGGIMDEEENLSSSSSLFDGDDSPNSTEDSASSSSSCSSSKGPLFDMSSLKEQLLFKRGLSKFYQGKSQSFTSLSDIGCVEDLAKPERPTKKLKTSTSCGEGDKKRSSLPLKPCNKRAIFTKKGSKCSLSSQIRTSSSCLLRNKPPLYPFSQRTSNLSHQSLWFA